VVKFSLLIAVVFLSAIGVWGVSCSKETQRVNVIDLEQESH
jgi:hypothetical protein